MLSKGASGFQQAEIAVPVTLDSGELMLTKAQLQGPEADAALAAADIQGAVIRGANQAYGDKGIRLLSEGAWVRVRNMLEDRSEEHTSELQSIMRISYDVFCLNKNK